MERGKQAIESASANIDLGISEGNALLVQLDEDCCFDGTVDFQSSIDGATYTNTPYISSRAAAPSRSVSQLSSLSGTNEYLILPPLTQVRIKVTYACAGSLSVVWREVEYNGPLADSSSSDISTLLTNTSTTGVGRTQIATTTIDLEQAAASYDLFTGTTQDVILKSLIFQMPNVDASDDCALTSISIQTDDVTAGTIIDSTTGAVANLTAEAQLAWTGALKITVASKIQLTIGGGTADEATVCNIIAEYEAITAGGTLA